MDLQKSPTQKCVLNGVNRENEHQKEFHLFQNSFLLAFSSDTHFHSQLIYGLCPFSSSAFISYCKYSSYTYTATYIYL